MRDAVVILNPTAGRGRAARLKECIVLAAEAGEEKWPIVVALGGDGTAHGVANGLLESKSVHSVLGHLPLGTGNDFARMLGFRRERIDRAFGQLASGVERRFDVGRAVGEYFRGTHTALPPVSILRASRVSVSSEANHSMVIHLDGKLRVVSEPRVEAEIVPAALCVICASSC